MAVNLEYGVNVDGRNDLIQINQNLCIIKILKFDRANFSPWGWGNFLWIMRL